MNENPNAVFRTNSLRRAEEQAQDVLPRFISPRIFLALWLLVGMLVGAGVAIWLATGGG
jgi:hypothetical protein